MKDIKVIIKTVILTCLALGMVFSIRLFIRRTDHAAPLGQVSPSGKYAVVQLRDDTERIALLGIYPTDHGIDPSDFAILPRYYLTSTFGVSAAWANDKDDLFVVNTDDGAACFVFDGETWIEHPFYAKTENGAVKYWLQSAESGKAEEYASISVPSAVVKFLKNR